MLKDKKLIIFDMDGTLLDSAPSLAFAANYMRKMMGKEPLSVARIRQFIGNGSATLVKKAYLNKQEMSENEISNAEFEKAHRMFLDFYGKNLNSKTELYPGALETLKELKKRGYILTLATNKPHQFVLPMLQHFNLLEYFQDYIGANEKLNKKPAADMLVYLCKKFKIDPKNSVMVGDSQNDILAAKNANIDSIAVEYGYYGGDIKELHPTYVVENLLKIPEILNG